MEQITAEKLLVLNLYCVCVCVMPSLEFRRLQNILLLYQCTFVLFPDWDRPRLPGLFRGLLTRTPILIKITRVQHKKLYFPYKYPQL